MSPITELVEMQLREPVDQFVRFFEAEQLPVLLNAPGIVSVRTGPKLQLLGRSLTYMQDSTAAVSITLWDSMEAHEAFLRSEPAKGFFDRVSHWISGPPEVSHYDIGDLRGLEDRAFVIVSKVAKLERAGGSEEGGNGKDQHKNRMYVTKSGGCVEDKSLALEMVFCPDLASLESAGAGHGATTRAFGVHVRSIGLAIGKAHL